MAELIYRFALIEDLYFQSSSDAIEELERTVVKLYTRILSYLLMAKKYLEQGTASTYTLSTTFMVITKTHQNV